MKSINFTKEVFCIKCDIEVRYWNETEVNCVEDVDFIETKGNGSPLIPCAIQVLQEPTNVIYSNHWRWRPLINIEKGQIMNWQFGVTANVHYKVYDGFACSFIGLNDEVISEFDGYVPKFMSPSKNGFGDHINMFIDKYGYIKDWNKNQVNKFLDSEFC